MDRVCHQIRVARVHKELDMRFGFDLGKTFPTPTDVMYDPEWDFERDGLPVRAFIRFVFSFFTPNGVDGL